MPALLITTPGTVQGLSWASLTPSTRPGSSERLPYWSNITKPLIIVREEFQLDLPEPGRYGTGLIFLDPDSAETSRLVVVGSLLL